MLDRPKKSFMFFLLQRCCAPLAGIREPSMQRDVEEDPENPAVRLSTTTQLRLHLIQSKQDTALQLNNNNTSASISDILILQAFNTILKVQFNLNKKQTPPCYLSTQVMSYFVIAKFFKYEHFHKTPDIVSTFEEMQATIRSKTSTHSKSACIDNPTKRKCIFHCYTLYR